MCIYTYTYIYIYIYVYTYVYIYTHMNTCPPLSATLADLVKYSMSYHSIVHYSVS